MSSYEAERESDKAQEGCCSCSAFLLSTGAVVWVLTGILGFWKAIFVGLIMTLTTWVLAIMGIIPIFGQWLYKLFAEEVIIWVYGLLQVNPHIELSLPGWINSFVQWILCIDEIFGVFSCIVNKTTPTLAIYTFGVGYTLSILVSISVVLGIIFTVIRKRSLRSEQD